MKALIIGYGSIGKRHHQILSDLDVNCALVSKHYTCANSEVYKTLEEASHSKPDYIVIANETSLHLKTLQQALLLFPNSKFLVEKPLGCESIQGSIISNSQNIFIGYNLRFHPILQRIRKLIENKRVLTSHIYVGQYLPDWRPEQDYRSSYSADRSKGGGVLFDLSHEIDYATWLLGPITSTTGLVSKVSSLEISSPDTAILLTKHENCDESTIHMDYLDRNCTRQIIINTDTHSIKADLTANTIIINKESFSVRCERNYTYSQMHKEVLDGNSGTSLCTLTEGVEITNYISSLTNSGTGPNGFI
tara:strand:- start:6066 stop:6980 length:915 start_codon:yes stop_codon:yes gene_type:complete